MVRAVLQINEPVPFKTEKGKAGSWITQLSVQVLPWLALSPSEWLKLQEVFKFRRDRGRKGKMTEEGGGRAVRMNKRKQGRKSGEVGKGHGRYRDWQKSGSKRATEGLWSAVIAFQRVFSLPHGWWQLEMGRDTRKKGGFTYLSLQNKDSTVPRFTLETFFVKEDRERRGNMYDQSLKDGFPTWQN